MTRSVFISLCMVLALVLVSPPLLAEDEVAPASPMEFPREIVSDGARVVVHVPQIDSWEGFTRVVGRLAVRVTLPGSDAAVAGTAEFTADTDANVEKRVVAVDNVTVTGTSFPTADEGQQAALDAAVRGAVRKRTHYVPLDVVLSYIADDATIPSVDGLSFEPPSIFYSSTPAVLLMTDGEPVLAPLPDARLQYVVNTNWDLFRYKDKEWYLRLEDRWVKAKSLVGPWKFDSSLPGDFKKLPDDGNWQDVKGAMPPAKGGKDVPTIFVSEKPAELIVTEGKPTYSTVGAAGLEYVYDTTSDVFRFDGIHYYLVSGRWFSSITLQGPWEHVSELPVEFATIPPGHDKSHVLAAIAGTDEARLAVLEASIPRKATVARDAGANVSVFYQGEPVFESITGTEVERAVNSSGDVLLHDGTYYLCKDAVWFTATVPEGPWSVADSIPAAIYSIPPSSASYHVTHVHVYESDDDSVSTGYTSGYFGVHIGFGVAMYGSGWYYPPYYGYGSYYGYPYYPYYYPYPYSYGSSAWYNPNTGMYGRSGAYYGPYGGYGRAASYNPQTGAYARGAAVWDGDEIAGSGFAYNPRTGTGIATNRYANEHGGWGESLITHNDKWVQTRSEWNEHSRNTEFLTSGGTTGQIERRQEGDITRSTGEFQRGDQSLSTRSVRGEQGGIMGLETGTGERAVIGRNADGDWYAGRDGQVYQRNEDGWYQNSGDGWNKVEERNQNRNSWDANRRSELNRSYNARNNGYDRYNRRNAAGINGAQRARPDGPRRRRR